MNRPQYSWKKAFGISVLLLLVACGLYYGIKNPVSLREIQATIENAPGWIFLLALLVLPPLAVPLSIFLVAVGARFDFVYAAIAASLAIVAHHLIAVGISRLFSQQFKVTRGSNLWKKLEEKTGGNTSKLLFFWGLTPGIPYVVKLYLPLAMGVRAVPFVKWNGSGHLLGGLMFVGLGQALFQGVSGWVIGFIGLGIISSLVFTVYKKRLFKQS